MTKIDLFKKWEKIKKLVPTLQILLGRWRENRPTFLRKNMFYPPVSVHHRGWVSFALRCTQSTMGLKVAYLQLWLVKG